MFNEVLVGVQNNADGIVAKARGGKQGDQLASSLHGDYYEQTYRGNSYGLNGALTTTTAAGAATFTGLAVGNPVGSGVNLAVGNVRVSQGAALTAATMIGVMYGPATLPITASLTTIFNRNPLGPVSKCTATAGQTITAPTAFIVFGGSGSGAITVPLLIQSVGYDFAGSLIIPPGYFFASYTSLVSTTALLFTFNWTEVPI
jgi:hypothetical protein